MFTENERQIYTCPITGRKYDPLAVKRSLAIASRGGFNAAVADSRSTDAVIRASGQERLVTYARSALSLLPINPETGVGWLDVVVLDAITAFTRWLAGKGGRVQSGPNSAPCTDCPGQ